jgi:hypothetical protein
VQRKQSAPGFLMICKVRSFTLKMQAEGFHELFRQDSCNAVYPRNVAQFRYVTVNTMRKIDGGGGGGGKERVASVTQSCRLMCRTVVAYCRNENVEFSARC